MAHERSCGPILIVDADPRARAETARVLAEAGLEAVEVSSGEECLARAREQPPALVAIEVNLPRLSGYEVCHELREGFGPGLPILFMSADRTEPRDRVAGLYVGGDDYLAKPFDAGEFLARVTSLLRRTPQPAGANTDLTEREHEVLQLLAEGLSQRAIARMLVISPRTVGSHIQSIIGKLNVHSRTEAVAHAYRDGLVHRGDSG
jgi:DNA-binding NarL/FixJ family response regulator